MKRLLTALVAAAALGISGCGGGGSNVQPPPPTGNYSLSSLSGQYAFVTNGEVFTSGANAPTSLARTGVFMADGKGNITGGMEDTNTNGTPSNAIVITSGSYTVAANGRGAMTLNFQGGGAVDFGIVLTSTSDGLLIDETSNANQASTGSGNFVLQQSTPFALSEIAGTYVFDFSGFDGSQPNPNPESFIGEFTVDSATGTIPTGHFDDNVGGTLTSDATMTPGTISQDPSQLSSFTSFGRGIATIAGQNFVFFIVNSNHVRFLSTNNGMLSGDAVAQASIPSSLNSGFVFVVGGSSANGGLTRVGRFTATGPAVTNILMDINDAGSERQSNTFSNASATLDATTGRGTVTFQDSSLTYTFVFYLSSPNSGVIQDVSPSTTVGVARDTADGSLALQSAGPLTPIGPTQPYAINWSGLVVAGGSFPIEDEEDLLAQANVTNLALSGAADIFQFTSSTLTPQLDLGVGGVIMINGDGTGADGKSSGMTVNLTGARPINFVAYFVSPQLAFFANRDNSGTTRIVVGVLKLQQ